MPGWLAAPDRHHARAADLDRLEQRDEGVELVRGAGDLEHEAAGHAVDQPRVHEVGEPQALDQPLAVAGHLDQRQLPLDVRPLDGEVLDPVHRHELSSSDLICSITNSVPVVKKNLKN